MTTKQRGTNQAVPLPRTEPASGATSEPASGPTSEAAAQIDLTAMPNLAGLRVLIIGINYAPEPTGIAPYTTGVAEQLARYAEHVTVLTGLPHYPSWTVPAEYRPQHRPKQHRPRQHWLRQHCPKTVELPEPGRPQVKRLTHYVPQEQTAIKRVAYEVTFGLHALWAARSEPRPDLVVCATPSLSGAAAAARIAAHHDVPLITIVQDLVAKATSSSGIDAGGLIQRATATLERYALTRATRVAVVSDSFRPAVTAYGVADERIALLPNWTHVRPSTATRDEARQQLGWPLEQFIVAHTGNIGLKQDLGNVVEAGRALVRMAQSADDVQLLIIGDGSQRAAIAGLAVEVPTVTLVPPLSDADYPLALAAADVLLVNERASVGNMSMPSKLTSYLAAGRPVLAAVADDGATAAMLTRTNGAAQLISPGNPQALAQAVMELSDDHEACARMALAAAEFADRHLGAPHSMAQLAEVAVQAAPPKARALRRFTTAGYDKGRGKAWQVAWFVAMNLVFSTWWCPARLRPAILRAFGADVGKRVLIRHRVRVLWPWKLSIGDDCWIGEQAWLLNLERITIEDNVCISQEALLCTGSHDHHDPAFGYRNAPITVRSGAWVAARAIVLPGATVDAGSLVPAGTRHQNGGSSGTVV